MVLAAAAAFALGAGTGVAHAGVAHGPWGYFNHGYTYEGRSTIITNPGYASSQMFTARSPGNAPPGYMGGSPRMYRSTGSLTCVGGWRYNSSTTTIMDVRGCDRGGSGAWYTYGQVRGFNGATYVTYSPPRSPNQNS